MKTLMKVAVVVGLLLAVSFQAEAWTSGGCTPGYWKNHVGSWAGTGYAPNMLVTAVFSNAGTGNMTLLEALSLPGGPGVEGARNILLRAAVASLLNAAKLGSAYNWVTPTYITNWVTSVLTVPSRYWYLVTATELDVLNNTGPCPLN